VGMELASLMCHKLLKTLIHYKAYGSHRFFKLVPENIVANVFFLSGEVKESISLNCVDLQCNIGSGPYGCLVLQMCANILLCQMLVSGKICTAYGQLET